MWFRTSLPGQQVCKYLPITGPESLGWRIFSGGPVALGVACPDGLGIARHLGLPQSNFQSFSLNSPDVKRFWVHPLWYFTFEGDSLYQQVFLYRFECLEFVYKYNQGFYGNEKKQTKTKTLPPSISLAANHCPEINKALRSYNLSPVCIWSCSSEIIILVWCVW